MKYFFLVLSALYSAMLTGQTIAEIQGSANASPFDGMVVTTTGIVTGTHAQGYFIQDGQGMWSGIYVYDSTNTPAIGDGITITATVEEYFDLTELKTVTSFITNSTGNTLPSAELLATSEAAQEGWESVLVRVESAVCTQDDAGFGEYFVNDGSGDLKCDDLLHVFVPTLGTSYNFNGIMYYSFSEYKLLPRNSSDVEIAEPLYFTVLPEEFDMMSSSLTVRWETNVPSNSIVFYGLTDQYELGIASDETQVTQHEISLTGLAPATSYYVQVISEDSEFSTPTYSFIVSTASENAGSIEVWFNHIVNTSVALPNNEAYTSPNITADIIAQLQTAESTLDVTMYDLNGAPVELMTTLNELYEAGVQIRFITDSELENTALELLNDGIPVLAGNSEGIMHDKFIVGDAGLPTAWTMTGSMNWTWANLGWDYNNIVVIHDQAVARTFKREFEEMWGGSEAAPNADNAKFGSAKTNNTAHKFFVNNTRVDVYFSPSDGTTQHIRERIEGATNELAFALLVFTENSLGSAIVTANNNGINTQGIIDYTQFNGSEYDLLVSEGTNTVAYFNADGSEWPDGPVLHHKYLICDFATSGGFPVTVTGSHNWSASAESINDENTVIIYDEAITNLYYQEFFQRYVEITSGVQELSFLGNLYMYPNPATEAIRFDHGETLHIELYNNTGSRVIEKWLQPSEALDIRLLPSGLYFVKAGEKTGRFVKL